MELSEQSKISENPVRLIQITDCHLGALTNESLLGLNTDQSLGDVLQLIAREQPNFDWLVCTGDIASAGHDNCYHRFVDIAHSHVRASLAWLPGNHDSAQIMTQVTKSMAQPPESRLIDRGNWRIVLLDSSLPGYVHGQLSQDELAFLEQSLSENPHDHAIVMLHHQPVPVGSAWIDQYILRNADDFFAVLDRYPSVKAVSWGHVHQAFQEERNGVLLLATPSTSVQFKPNQDDFAVDTAMPGYRWYELHPDGRLDTGVSRVTDKAYTIDYQSAGY